MSSVETLNVMPRRAVLARDPLVWQATLAAARRVMGYHASKSEAGSGLRVEADSSLTDRTQRAADSRLAA